VGRFGINVNGHLPGTWRHRDEQRRCWKPKNAATDPIAARQRVGGVEDLDGLICCCPRAESQMINGAVDRD